MRRPSAGFVLLLALIVLVGGAKAILYDTLDPDLFWHLRVADQLSAKGIEPLMDEISFASIREPWTPYSWLAEIGMKTVWDVGGFRLTVLLQAVVQAAFLGFVALACLERNGEPMGRAGRNRNPASLKARHGGSSVQSPAIDNETGADGAATGRELPILLAIALTAYWSLPFLSFRPVTFVLTLVALCWWLVQRDRRMGGRSFAVWLTVPVAILATNMHFFSIYIPALIGAMAFSGSLHVRRRDSRKAKTLQDSITPHPHPLPKGEGAGAFRYAALAIFCAVGCCVTPLFWGVVESVRRYSTGDPMVGASGIAEFSSTFGGIGGLVNALLIATALVLFWRGRIGAGEWVAVGVASLLMLKMSRGLPIFAIVAAPLLSATLPRMRGAALKRRPVALAMGVILAVGLFRIVLAFPTASTSLDSWLNRNGPETPGYPVGAAGYVSEHVTPVNGRLINEFSWGGYLAWRLGDRYQVLLDGRTQLYTPEFWHDAYLGSPAETSAMLTRYPADAAVVPLERSRFRSALVSQGWVSVWRDDRAEVLVPGDAVVDGR